MSSRVLVGDGSFVTDGAGNRVVWTHEETPVVEGLPAAPYGAVPYGALPLGVDGSVSSPVGALYAGVLRETEHLFIVWPKIDGVVTPYYFCLGLRHYYATDAAGVLEGVALPHMPFDPRLVQSLSFRQTVLDRGEPVTGVTAYGTVRIADPLRELPFAADGTDWTNAPFLYMQGSPDWAIGTFAPIQRGFVVRSLPVETPGPAHELVLRDQLSILTESAAPEVYRGMGACLQMDGALARIFVADQEEIRVVGDLTLSAWVWPFSLGFGVIVGRGNTSYRFRYQPDGSLWTLLNDGTGYFTASSPPGVVVAGRWQHLACTVTFAGGSATVRWYVGTSTTPSTLVGSAVLAISSIAPAVGAGLHFGGESFGESIDGRIDEAQVWNIALPVEKIDAYRQREIAGDTPGLKVYHRMNAATGTDSFDSSPSAAHGILADGPVWVGSGEGGPALAGRRKPVGAGIIRHRELVWIDDVDQVGQFDAHASEEVLAVLIGGPETFTLHANVTDVYASTPPGGTYTVDLERSWMRFGGTRPNLTVLVDFKARIGSGPYVETTGAIGRQLAAAAGVAAGAIDDSGFGAVDILHPGPVGIGANGNDATYDKLLLALAHGVYGWRSTDILGRVTMGALDMTRPFVADIGGNLEIAVGGRDPIDQRRPVSRIEVLYRRYEKTLSRSETAADILTETQIEDLGKEYRVYTTPTLSTEKGAVPLVVTTCFDEEEGARALGDLLTPIFSGKPRTDSLTLTMPRHGVASGMIVRVTADLPGYETGRKLVISGRDVDDQNGRHRWEVFG